MDVGVVFGKSYSKRYYELLKKSFFIEVYRTGHIGWLIEHFSASVYVYVSSDKWHRKWWTMYLKSNMQTAI